MEIAESDVDEAIHTAEETIAWAQKVLSENKGENE